jgi:hypothetical protein
LKRWKKTLYEPLETQISGKSLENILKLIKGNICLLGGWATYHVVNKNFERIIGTKYIGSRDIDIGFHIHTDWTEEQIERSEFSTAIKKIEDMGFRSVSFRLVKDFNLETGRALTPKESTKLPQYQIFSLFVDPIVDYIHPKIKHVLGFIPIDEPLLSLVFDQGLSTTTNLFGTTVLLPKTQVLLAMKLNSVTNRDQEHKRIKDIADIYAILWFSDTKIKSLKNQLFSIYPEEKARKTIRTIKKEEINRVSTAIGADAREITRVLTELK